MKDLFNIKEWEEKIKNPNWYLEIPIVLKKVQQLRSKNSKIYENIKEEVFNFFEEKLRNESVVLGKEGKNFDAERKLIDTVVIHHTHNLRGITLERLSAMTLLRLYVMEFYNPTYEGDKEIKGKPIYSGHFRDGKQVFYPYHWIIRNGGKAERLLDDSKIGWHAGNWDVNCRSISIVLDNNYENSEPPQDEMDSIVEIIRNNYPQIKKDRIFGHREINPNTTCPSNLFLGENGWKKKIIREI